MIFFMGFYSEDSTSTYYVLDIRPIDDFSRSLFRSKPAYLLKDGYIFYFDITENDELVYTTSKGSLARGWIELRKMPKKLVTF